MFIFFRAVLEKCEVFKNDALIHLQTSPNKWIKTVLTWKFKLLMQKKSIISVSSPIYC